MSEIDITSNPTRELVNMVISRYRDQINPEELKEIQRGVERINEAAQALKTVDLDNSNEPLSIFKPFRAQENGE